MQKLNKDRHIQSIGCTNKLWSVLVLWAYSEETLFIQPSPTRSGPQEKKKHRGLGTAITTECSSKYYEVLNDASSLPCSS